ncbi:MAG: MFS transporter, partial [Acidobacteria bacterium]|nr:MFS transporter [Acidobacteriota bacterium]
PRRREAVLGYTQAFASLGGLLVSLVYYAAATYGDHLPAILGSHQAWRYTLISGVIPAAPLILVRPFLPESPVWAEERLRNTLRRPSLAELFRPERRRVTIVTTVVVAASYAVSFGTNLQAPRIVPTLETVRLLPRGGQEQAAGAVQVFQECGGLTGRILMAALAVWIGTRVRLVRGFLFPSLVIIPLVFGLAPAIGGTTFFNWGNFLAGLLTVGQFSFWGNYLPRVYPTYLRGTGESFAANIGGRLIGTSAALATTTLAGALPALGLSRSAALVGGAALVIGITASAWLPDPGEAPETTHAPAGSKRPPDTGRDRPGRKP